MNVFSAWPLILLLAAVPAHGWSSGWSFDSARKFNLCYQLVKKQWGPQKYRIETKTGKCNDGHTLDVFCEFDYPRGSGYSHRSFTCPDNLACIPNASGGQYPDAGCLYAPTMKGIKLAGDRDGHACSPGLRIGDEPAYVSSIIYADKPSLAKWIDACMVVQSGTDKHLYNHAPCDDKPVIIRLEALTTYQACVDANGDDAAMTTDIPYSWRLASPGNQARDLNGKSLSEMITIDNSTDSTFSITIGD
ncbi:hypothetical protein FKW77_007572 [Venturia effusa]|uniref:Uncharacterized protein n=1 Tax=Venturia effusa TaxID=50376 RepID=A0A517L1L8_9PEZI|nr:hypothetical protein FKW77_007572 [Venturia effusa]